MPHVPRSCNKRRAGPRRLEDCGVHEQNFPPIHHRHWSGRGNKQGGDQHHAKADGLATLESLESCSGGRAYKYSTT